MDYKNKREHQIYKYMYCIYHIPNIQVYTIYHIIYHIYIYILVLGRLIDSSINNRLSVMFSDYRFVRSVIDESNCFCACASISLSIQYIHHYFFLISKTGTSILQCKTAQELRDGYGEHLHGQRPS